LVSFKKKGREHFSWKGLPTFGAPGLFRLGSIRLPKVPRRGREVIKRKGLLNKGKASDRCKRFRRCKKGRRNARAVYSFLRGNGKRRDVERGKREVGNRCPPPRYLGPGGTKERGWRVVRLYALSCRSHQKGQQGNHGKRKETQITIASA